MQKSKNKKKLIIPVIAAVVVVIVVVFLLNQNHLKFKGVIEATVVSHTAEVAGKIIEMPVELGAHVNIGDVLAKIDSSAQEYALQQLEITLQKQKLALTDLKVNGDSQADNNIAIAQANYSSAKSTSDKAAADYENVLSLYNEGAVSKDTLDSAKLNADSRANALTVAKAQLDNALSKTSAESLELDIEKTEIQIEQAKEDLEKYTIKSICDGIVMSKSYLMGDMVAAGYNLVDIASVNEKYFVFYLPKEDLDLIDYNQELTIIKNGESYIGVVKYMNVESEYTPKDMQTTANKNKESVKIKLLMPADTPIKIGEEAQLFLAR